VRVQGADHGFKGRNIKPGLEEIDRMVVVFFQKHLKK